ncbi:ADP-ribosylation factor-like protein 4A [Armadillidium nasatum]|uniref:ADP-ribosylation factor-like protein 4A n=1 Tax=Armadillidium nasatum TaxID=96803 RepID=A0A5N5TNN5_9CRUS|nr:ADP-ribosylation factor-like protein 4A [Armadillidium nasatum]
MLPFNQKFRNKITHTIINILGTSFLVWDVGGQDKLRPLWRSYTRGTDGIVFVVDATDGERLEEARIELLRTLRIPEHNGVPILILANKQDLPRARDGPTVEKLIGVSELGSSQLFHVQPACAITGEGLEEGLEKLYEMVCKRRKIGKLNNRSSKKR